MAMVDAGSEDTLVGQNPTWEQEYYCDWADQLHRNSLTVLDERLQRLVTLNAAILGGSFVFGQAVLSPGSRIVAVICLIASLLCALLGTFPKESNADRTCAYQVKACLEETVRFRGRMLKIASALLVAAFSAALVGYIYAVLR